MKGSTLKSIIALGLLGTLTYEANAGITLKDCSLAGKTYRCSKNLAYEGQSSLQKLDIWTPKNNNTQKGLVVYIHGGGYMMGDKDDVYSQGIVKPQEFLDAGFAFATINYRLSGTDPYRKGVTSNCPVQMLDSGRAVQFLRYNAKSLGVNKSKLVLTGGSAGGGISLWLNLHADIANTSVTGKNAESSRPKCVALQDMQPTLNIPEVLDLIGPDGWELDDGITGLYGITPEQYNRNQSYFDKILSSSYEEASPMKHLTKDDKARILMTYSLNYGEGNIHSPELGRYLAEGVPSSIKNQFKRKSLKELGVPYQLYVGMSRRNSNSKIKNFVNSCLK